jgi:hypothetical protein
MVLRLFRHIVPNKVVFEQMSKSCRIAQIIDGAYTCPPYRLCE